MLRHRHRDGLHPPRQLPPPERRATRRNINFPYFERDDYFTSPEMAAPRRFLASTGMCVASDGVAQSEDGTLASRNALLNMIHLLQERGWTREQAYCICSVAVDLKVSEVVDVPNFPRLGFPAVGHFQQLDGST